MFTIEKLEASKEYKDWIRDEVVLVHDTYHDIPDYSAFIVVTKRMDGYAALYTITRFFPTGITADRIAVSVDASDIDAEEVFKKLLKDYSTGLN